MVFGVEEGSGQIRPENTLDLIHTLDCSDDHGFSEAANVRRSIASTYALEGGSNLWNVIHM